MSIPILTKIKSENKFHYFVIPTRSGSSFMERHILLEKNFYDINAWYSHELNPLPKLDIDKLHIEFYARNPYRRLVSGFFFHWLKPEVYDLHEDTKENQRGKILTSSKEKKISKFSWFVEILYAIYKTYPYEKWWSKLAQGHTEIQHKMLKISTVTAGNHLCEDIGYIEPFGESVDSIRIEYKQIEDLENNFVLKENWKSTEHPDFGDYIRFMKEEYKDKEEYLNSFSKLGYSNDTYMDYYNSDVLKMVNEIYEKDFELWNYEAIV
jgi:hypothetical protein|tara:strand:- start:111 stop:908 length:798 start_codon:yes stop_codon:yes gene_type:complete